MKDDHDIPAATPSPSSSSHALRLTADHAVRIAAEHHRAGRIREAESIYREVLRQTHHRAGVLLLGTLLSEHGRVAGAAEVYRAAVERAPHDPELWDELALALARLRDFAEAERAARRAIGLNPADPLFHVHLANLLTESHRPEEALPIYRTAIERGAGNDVEAWYNLGVALYDLARPAEAIEAFDRALALDPHFTAAHVKRGMALLMTGDFERGWPAYEWRWRTEHTASHEAGDLRPGGGNVVLESDQGLGDAIQMIRYAPLVQERMGGRRVFVRCQPELHRLIAAAPGVAGVISTSTPPPAWYQQASRLSMMSLPHVFRTTPDTIPAAPAYLRADVAASAAWAKSTASDRRLRVGVAWAGNPAHRDDARRSCPPEQLRPLGEVPGVTFYSLQKHGGTGGGGVLPFDLVDRTAELSDLADTAALVENLDLVITVDTAVAHLAAALGKPTWILLAHVPDWRWMRDRDDSPWYPAARLFRQARRGDWFAAVARAASELAKLTSERSRSA